MEPQYERAKHILGPIWRGIPSEYKVKYALNIWTQFEHQVRSAAHTTNVTKFISIICAKLQAVISDRDLFSFLAAVGAGDDREILRVLRDESTYVVLLVRTENEERREAWKARQSS